MKISKYFRKIIFNSNTYSKYLNIRSEFTGEITLIKQEEKKKEEIKKEKEKKEEEKKIKKKRVHSISNIIKSAKVPDLNSIYNIQDKNLDKKIIVKQQEYSTEEESEESDEDEIKSEKINHNKNPKEKIPKLNLTEIKPIKRLKANITSSRIIKFNDNDEQDDDDCYKKKIKTKNMNPSFIMK